MQTIFSSEEEDIVEENYGDDEEEENDSVEDISESDDEYLEVVNLSPTLSVDYCYFPLTYEINCNQTITSFNLKE